MVEFTKVRFVPPLGVVGLSPSEARTIALEMYAELRRHVMLKMIRQAHEAELAEPGKVLSGIVGTPEW